MSTGLRAVRQPNPEVMLVEQNFVHDRSCDEPDAGQNFELRQRSVWFGFQKFLFVLGKMT